MNAAFHANWNYPTQIRFGADRVSEVPDALAALGCSRPLLVTDAGLADQAMILQTLSNCADSGQHPALFSAVSGNPTGAQVDNGVAAYRAHDADAVIAFGGGSALDAGKAVAFMSAQERPLWDFVDEGENYLRANVLGLPPCIAVPTTAGTGSEVGRASVITDQDARSKKIIFHPRMLPELVIADPVLTFGLPPKLTGATGMDALSHSMEAYFAPGFHPLAQGIAMEGMRLVFQYLPVVMSEPENLEARAHMLAASLAGATAFQKGLGGMHALAHPLGALYGAHHGTLNAVLMPYVLIANRTAIEAPAAALAHRLQLPEPGFDGLVRAVLALREQTLTPHTLADLEIPPDHATQIGAMAAADPSASGNPVAWPADAYQQIFLNALHGRLEPLS